MHILGNITAHKSRTKPLCCLRKWFIYASPNSAAKVQT